jgi:cysteine desulfurase
MSRPAIYLDHAATAPLLAEARDAWLEGAAIWANPSSPHAAGRRARAVLEEARERIKAALDWPGEVIFTSGASEALAIALTRCRLPLAAVSAVEHEAVLRHRGEGKLLQVDGSGCVDCANAALSGLVAVQQVNNETGVIQPLADIAEAVRGAGGLLLADCAQGAGKLPLPDADMIVIAAHKFGGPIGIGALLVRDFALLNAAGGQERGYRPGTENLPGALAMAAALEADKAWLEAARGLRSELESRIVAAGGEVIAREAQRIPTIGAYRMPGVSGTAQLIRFDAMGIAVSAGSACSSGSLRGSHVIQAMGLEGGNEIVRVSIGPTTTQVELDRFVQAWREIRAETLAAA